MLKPKLLLCLLFSAVALSSFAQKSWIPFNDAHLTYQGRIPKTLDAAVLCWSGNSVAIHFKGTSLAAVIKEADTANYYVLIVDHQLKQKLHFDTEKKSYTLVNNLPAGEHEVELFKITEWAKGKTFFYGFELNKDEKVLPPKPLPNRKMEFYGNSITCAYGVDALLHDSPLGYFENNYESYAAITARHFNTQYSCISKSGIGIMLSWFPLIMPEMYDRTDPTDSSSKWDFSKYTPDLVVINLFQNDSWLVNKPEHPEFKHRFGTQKPSEDFIIKSYQDFVKAIRSKYPDAQIICMLGNMDITRKGSLWPSYVQKAVEGLNDKKIYTLFVPFKESSGHPSVKEQKVLAQGLIDFIAKNIKW